MTQIKELYDETGKPGVIETNDFGYYMQLKKQDVPVIFTGDAEKTLTLWRDLTNYLRVDLGVDVAVCETPHLCSKDHDSMDDDWY